MPTITTFLKSDRLLCDRLFHRVEQAVRRRSWRSACCAIERFNRALKQHLLMEEQVLFKALEQYSSDAAKSVAAMLQEHRQLRQVAASVTSAIRLCNARAFSGAAASLQMMMQEHCAKEEGVVLRMADHFLRPATRFLIDSMRSLQSRPGPGHPAMEPAVWA